MKRLYAVILCGGRGSRLEAVTEDIPKSLVQVHGKPLLWYTLLNLHKHGFNRFIFPVGYKGDMIEKSISEEFQDYNFEMHFIKTGCGTPIAKRLKKAINVIPDEDDFFMLNGDTFFDFDIEEMYRLHKSKESMLTMSSVELVSSYGLIIEENETLIDFTRESNISYVSLDATQNKLGYINAGLIWINKHALDFVNLDTCENLEQELFPKLIKTNQASHYKIQGNWFPIDTQKDLKKINEITNIDTKIGDIVRMAKKNLESRYSYRTQYFSNAGELKEKILNKTVIPHQVEVQPGPEKGNICWLKCPYCYGKTANDTGERLSRERYIKILSEIADGGVDKIIFAGYATDPLNYEYIEELHSVTLDSNQIFGFHTNAIKISDKLISQITSPNIRPLSYFSISVDAGFNDTYNKFHGVSNSTAKLYDKVCDNIRRVADARNKSGANLDISATYLISSMNNSSEEILKSINDLRDAGVDLIRFTFPQKPRGFDSSLRDFIPEKEEVTSDLKRLRDLIENENGNDCQVLIMDLDAEYSTEDIHRSLPCFARYIFPSIGFDGWLAHCSESASSHFREISLGNLQERSFWDIFYDYDTNNFAKSFSNYNECMTRLGCKCDRKEHVVNAKIRKSGIYNELVS